MKNVLNFTNCLFASRKATLLTTTTLINYGVSVLPNTAGQLCLSKETGYPEIPTMFGKSLTHRYSFHKNNFQIRLKPEPNHTQCVVLGNYGMVLSKLIAR